MFVFILRRILTTIPTLLVIATLAFFLIRLAPGGPFDSDKQIPEEILRNINAKYHLDEPLVTQYIRYLGMVVQGDLGPSFRYMNRTVNEIIAETFPVSASIGLLGLVYALLLGVTAGIFAASRPNSLRDYIPMFFSMLGLCLPSFVIGPLFVLFFGVHLGWFNISGWSDPSDVVLPALTLGTMYAAFFARLTRGGILEIVRQDYIRTAHAKGVPPWIVMLRHT